ncbi:hypothetical protein CLOM_g9762 [Closterium sp. NIES-68]|nr:hypothetical protein CLOM_g9762 [Closterium sp. NIES-68]GJP76732.1 hypothetical protein CLOP_g7198 [Closterium sp. NIES-67]
MTPGAQAVPPQRAGRAASIHGRGSALSGLPRGEWARDHSAALSSATSFRPAAARSGRALVFRREILGRTPRVALSAPSARRAGGSGLGGGGDGRTLGRRARCSGGNGRAMAPRATSGDGGGSGAAVVRREGGRYLEGAARFWRDARAAYAPDPLGLEMAAIALPALLALAADPLASLVDTFYIGQIGAVELGGVGVAISVFSLVSKVLNVPLLNVTTSFVAQDEHALSQQRQEQEKGSSTLSSSSSPSAPAATLSSPSSLSDPPSKPVVPSVSAALLIGVSLGVLEALFLALAAGPVLTVMGLAPGSPMREPALQYLLIRAVGAPAVVLFLTTQGAFRGLKDTRTPLAASVSGNVVNIVLDPILMFSCALGVSGAAAATVAAQYVMAGFLLVKLSSRVHLMPPALSHLTFGRFFKSGGLLLGRTVALLGCMTLATSMAARQGAVPMAAHQVSLQIWLAASLLSDSTALAAQTLLASAFACNDAARVRAIMLRSLQIGLGMGVLMGLLLALAAPLLPAIFTSDQAVLLQAAALMPFAAAMQPITSLAFVFDGLHYGANDFAFAAIAMIALAPAAAAHLLLAPSEWGLEGVWIGLSLIMAARMYSGFLRVGTGGGAWAVLLQPQPHGNMSDVGTSAGDACNGGASGGGSGDTNEGMHTAEEGTPAAGATSGAIRIVNIDHSKTDANMLRNIS